MNYSKPMIELVYEIRRLVPSAMKPGVKLANPELFQELIEHYHSGATTVTKALIKELLSLAGEHWPDTLAKHSQRQSPALQSKMYRGVVSLEETPPKDKTLENTSRKKRIYRGQVIA